MMLVSTDRPIDASNATPSFHARLIPAAVTHEGYRTAISIYGEHDSSNNDSLRALVDDAISSDATNVEIHLSGVRFMSSATIRVFLASREYLELRGRSLTLISPTPIGRRLLDLCGLTYRSDG